jgi:hypothetical protein
MILRGPCHPEDIARFGVNEIATPAHIHPGACAEFRAEVLKVFGPSGERNLHEEPFLPHELGRLPLSRVEPE